jgi:N-acetylgalactosamine kinase
LSINSGIESAKELTSANLNGSGAVERALSHYCGGVPELVQSVYKRLGQLAFVHEKAFGKACSFIRTPGRINLIGEHTDYNGLPVLPMTLDRDILVAYSARDDDKVIIRNINPNYDEKRITIERDIKPSPWGEWDNYAKAALQALVEWNEKTAGNAKPLSGMEITIDGSIPSKAGLSSSSALLVSLAYAVVVRNSLALEKRELAELMAYAEHYVGTCGGGMDQAITMLGEPGHALCIDFFPLRTEAVPLPSGWRIIAAHSLVQAKKTGNQRLNYNLRPLECRIGVALYNQLIGRSAGRPIERLGDLESDIPASEILARIEEFIPEPVYSWELLDAAFGVEAKVVLSDAKAIVEEFELKRDHEIFKPADRVRHVVSEGKRVRDCAKALREGRMADVGELFNQSDASCHRDYEIGTPELAQLSGICREAGSLGSRLTGAGFGGFVISLVAEDKCEEFKQQVSEKYYADYLKQERPDLYESMPDINDVLFTAIPTCGCSRLRLLD